MVGLVNTYFSASYGTVFVSLNEENTLTLEENFEVQPPFIISAQIGDTDSEATQETNKIDTHKGSQRSMKTENFEKFNPKTLIGRSTQEELDQKEFFGCEEQLDAGERTFQYGTVPPPSEYSNYTIHCCLSVFGLTFKGPVSA